MNDTQKPEVDIVYKNILNQKQSSSHVVTKPPVDPKFDYNDQTSSYSCALPGEQLDRAVEDLQNKKSISQSKFTN